MKTDTIRDSFAKLLESLCSKELISEEAKNGFIAEVDKKLAEAVAEDQAVSDEKANEIFKAGMDQAVNQIKSEYDAKLAANGEQPETEDNGEVADTVEQAFKDFIDCLPEENIKAFNDLSASFTEDQLKLMKAFLSGDFCFLGKKEEPENPEQEEKKPEENNAEPEVAPEEDEVMEEAVSMINGFASILHEAGLDRIGNSVLSEASDKLSALIKKQNKEYEKFLKLSAKNLARQNKELQMAGGVVGGTRRLKNLDTVLQKLRKKLYLEESKNAELSSQLTESVKNAEGLKITRDQENQTLEMLNRENLKLNESNEQLVKEKSELEAKIAELEKEKNSLTESVKNAEAQVSKSEAKALLVESTKDMNPRLRKHLSAIFEGKTCDEIKGQLDEAVEAYWEDRRDSRQNLRKNSQQNPMSRLVTEAVENKEDEAQDAFVSGLAAYSESHLARN